MHRKSSVVGTFALLFALVSGVGGGLNAWAVSSFTPASGTPMKQEGTSISTSSSGMDATTRETNSLKAGSGGKKAFPHGPDTLKQRLIACTACHGQEGRATSEGYFPRIAGKPAGYLYHQLINFREGRRNSPMMSYMVKHLSDDYLKEMADYFSNQHIAYAPVESARISPAILAQGERLVRVGDASRQIPACIACHGNTLMGMSPDIPGLLGLPRHYLSAQLSSWSNGLRRTEPPDCMAKIARQLTGNDIYAVTAWLASQPVPEYRFEASTVTLKLPVPCGSVR